MAFAQEMAAIAAAPPWFRISLLVDVAQIVAGLSAAVSVIYLARQLKTSLKEQKIERSHDYLRRYNSTEFRPVVAETIFFMRGTSKTEEEKISILLDRRSAERKHLASKVILCFNFFEEMGLLYNRNAVDKALVENFFAPVSLDLEGKGMFFIKAKREEQGQSSLWDEWLRMNSEFRAKNKSGSH